MESKLSYRLRLTFQKLEQARFLSHLDLMATLEYAVRRARLPVELSEGYNPRPRLSLASPLALGHTGEAELLDIVLREPVPPGDVAARLQAAVPPGITIVGVEEMPAHHRTSASHLVGSRYRIDLADPVPDLSARVSHLLARDSITVQDMRENQIRSRNIRPYIDGLLSPDPQRLRLHLRMDEHGSVRPEQILDELSVPRDGVRIVRESIDLSE